MTTKYASEESSSWQLPLAKVDALRYHLPFMATVDPRREFERLSEIYSQMSDEQLQEIADDFTELTEVAQDVLRAEFNSRQLELPNQRVPQQAIVTTDETVTSGPNITLVENPQPANADGLVEIARFRDVPVASMVKGALESAGIQCFLADDQMINTNWFYSNALGGVKILVSPADFDAAKEVLEQPIPERIAFAEGEEYEQPKCPKCGSLNVSFQNIDEATAFGSAWIGIPLPYTLDRWECKDCEAIWKDDDEADAHPEDATTDDTGRDCS
jgi:Putative prokaryotic signal transducing protein